MIEAMGDLGASTEAEGAAGFATSRLFERTFREGMTLVEDAAAYLDGEGRQASKELNRDAALHYASESMALTTRLMQVASWLLVQRAVREGEMSPAEAGDARYRVSEPGRPRTVLPAPQSAPEDAGPLPEGLRDLAGRADRLFERIVHLDRRLYVEPAEIAAHPVLSQFDRLREAFAGV